MLIGIEGPDRAGKTTLLGPVAAALGAKRLTRLPTSKEAFAAWHLVEPIYLHLLEQLLEPGRFYVTDRSMTVSGLVYAAAFERPVLFDPKPWVERELVVYVDTPLEVMRERWRAEEGERVFPEAMYERVIAEYRRTLREHGYASVRVDGTASVEANARAVADAVSKWRAGERPVARF